MEITHTDFNGRERKFFPVVREAFPFVKGLLALEGVVDINVGEFRTSSAPRLCPVDVLGYFVTGDEHRVSLQFSTGDCIQDIHVFCNKRMFSEVIDYVNHYCLSSS